MKMKTKAMLLICLCLCAMLFVGGCAEESIYEEYDEEGFSVSVRFDANGGTMMTQVTAIVDTFNIADMKTNSNGEVEIALLDPTDERRGNGNVCSPSYAESGYYLAGWYSERTENSDGSYTYAKPWNFETDRVRVNPNDTHSASKPVITLYARWEKLLQVEVYDRATNELLDTLKYDPNQEQIQMPEWKEDSAKGAIDLNDMPEKEGYTFKAAYYDLEGTLPIDTENLIHAAETDSDATSMKIYIDWLEGEWYHIYSAKQLSRSADPNGHYVICADLDFSKVDWPEEFMYEEFTGTFVTLDDAVYHISNIIAGQDNVKYTKAGLFGTIGESAVISNVSFDNVVFTIQAGCSKDCAFGLFTGKISDKAQLSNIQITSSQLRIESDIAKNAQYKIGLVCAEGYTGAIDFSGIDCSIVEVESAVELWKFDFTVDGNNVIIEEK